MLLVNLYCCGLCRYLKLSYFNDTLILATFVSMDLAHINFSDFTKLFTI